MFPTTTTAFASHLKQSKKHLHDLTKTMKWPRSKEKFTTTFENTVTLVNENEIIVTGGKGPALEPGEKAMEMSMQFTVTGDIDDDDDAMMSCHRGSRKSYSKDRSS